MFKNSYRGRGKGRGRGTRRPAPYTHRTPRGTDDKLPMPTPDERLPGVTTAEKAVSRAKDEVRLANDWKSYYTSILRGKDTHCQDHLTHIKCQTRTQSTRK